MRASIQQKQAQRHQTSSKQAHMWRHDMHQRGKNTQKKSNFPTGEPIQQESDGKTTTITSQEIKLQKNKLKQKKTKDVRQVKLGKMVKSLFKEIIVKLTYKHFSKTIKKYLVRA